jgi:RNA:NAD 2'-phosphotransferase (TPT1/KptA family)
LFIRPLTERLRAGAIFYLAKNGVWLTEHVPAEYLEIDGGGQGAEL